MTDATLPPHADMRPPFRWALFDYGFRPFFLLCGLYAVIMVPWWLYRFMHAGTPFGALPSVYWHGHEMLYGFVMAAIAGFLLTAVPSWTGSRGFAGPPLIAVVLVWALGRIAMAGVGSVPFWVSAAVELALIPCLLVLLLPPILRSGNRNAPLLGVLLVLWLLDAAFLTGVARGDALLAGGALRLGIDLVLVMITVIGGRILPAFTANALRARGIEPRMTNPVFVERTTIAAMLAIVVLDVFAADSRWSGGLAALAAAAHVTRLAGWRGWRAHADPLVWILHVGYAWLPIGLALKAAALLGDAAWAIKWQHALTMGGFGTMILAVMTRAALGHTGRALRASGAIVAAYVILTVGTVLRVFGAAWFPEHYARVLSASGLAWVLCFLIFTIVYAPILCGPRADWKHG